MVPCRNVCSSRACAFLRFALLLSLSAAVLFVNLSCARAPARGAQLIKAKGKTAILGRKGMATAPVRSVVLKNDFEIDRTEVSAGLFQTIMGKAHSIISKDTSMPVTNVSWLEAAQFCNRRSLKQGLAPCYTPAMWICDRSKNGYRLPTEAEWEFACRAGAIGRFFWGDRFNGKYCWTKENSRDSLHAVATKKPNRWGLYDMIGNVWEWCDDRYVAKPGSDSAGYWQLGPKVLKGGSWSSDAASLGCAERDSGAVESKSKGVGFRCVRTVNL